jgi:excisionase family DNA binding protein
LKSRSADIEAIEDGLEPDHTSDVVVLANQTNPAVTRAPTAAGYRLATVTMRYSVYVIDLIAESPALDRPQVDGGSSSERAVLTVPEAARYLGISTSHAYELVHTGVIPAIRLGRRILIARRSIDQLLESGAGHSS